MTCDCIFDSCLFTYIRCDRVKDLNLVPRSEFYSKRYRIVYYLLLCLCLFRIPFSLKSSLDAFDAVRGHYSDPAVHKSLLGKDDVKRIYAVLRTFLAILSTVIPLSGIVATLWQSTIICIVTGILWSCMSLLDVSVAIAFGEQLFHIQYIVDMVIVCLLFYFSRLILMARDYY